MTSTIGSPTGLRLSPAVRRIRAASRRPVGGPSTPDTVSLAMGEPDLRTPQVVVDAAVDALRTGWTHYGDIDGDPDLRGLIASSTPSCHGPLDPAWVTVTHGGTAGITATILALTGPGDRVVIPEPTYSLYLDAVNLAGATPVLVPTRRDHHLDLDALAGAVPDAALIVLCNPVNPTGAVYTPAELDVVGGLLAGTETLVLVDEAYADLVFRPESFRSAIAIESLAGRLVLCRTLSKTYAMTGWRIGYVVAAPGVTSAIALVHRTMNMSVNQAVQRAAIAALRAGPALAAPMLAAYRERRDSTVARLQTFPGVQVVAPEGGFYVMVRYPGALDSASMTRLLAEHGVAVRAGSEYGPSGEGQVRVSFAAGQHDLDVALDRMEAVFASTATAAGHRCGEDVR